MNQEEQQNTTKCGQMDTNDSKTCQRKDEKEDQTGEDYFSKAESCFIEWTKQNMTEIQSLNTKNDGNMDLEEIAKAIGNSKFVALSEGFHNCKEMMSLHCRLIRYLIEFHGFNIVLSESGLPESRLIEDYISGEKEVPKNLWDRGINKMYGAWKEGRELIEYMREYNLRHGNVLHYYGTDIGGFYQNWKFPLENILEYLKTVDTEYYSYLSNRLDPFIEVLATSARLRYSEQLSCTQKDELAVILDESVENFNDKENLYTSRSNSEEFQWARQCMISMQLAENYYRNLENRKNPESSKFVGLNGREIAMARNSLWVLKQRPDKKVIWIDHVIHTKTKTQYQGDTWGYFTPAGQILKQVLGQDFFSIGMIYGGGQFWNNWQRPEERFIDSIPPWDGERRSLEKSLSKCEKKNFFLNWGKALSSSNFEFQYWMQSVFSMRENDYFIQIEPREWDACIYLEKASPATAVE
jgi:erythromycin esterase-like protein